MKIHWRIHPPRALWAAVLSLAAFIFLFPDASGQEIAGRLLAMAPDDVRVEAPSYRIGKEDVLQVMVYGEESLSARVPVRPDGKISVPLLGDITASGETPEGLSRTLEELYKAHVRAPAVTVLVVELKSFKVFLVGNIKTPGALTFGRETTLLQALAQAGGFSEFANTKRILIIREEDDGARRIAVNYDKIISGDNLEMNLKLKPGDTIVVP